MMANVAGNRAVLARAKIAKDIDFRMFRVQKETLRHILGQCTSTKKERIESHDSLKDFIIQRIADQDKEAAIRRKPTLSSPKRGVLKPDLVIKNREGVFVVDVRVRHKDKDYLQQGRRSKLDRYTPLLPELKQRFKERPRRFFQSSSEHEGRSRKTP
jgi:hypothetical protein